MTAKPHTTAPRIRHNLASYRRQQAKRQIITITLLTLAAVIAATL
tara:strand:- start:1629 stop:1763 length:135 start_codon:yes stop_codon:yes gene_type:complete